ncbi:MAG TPA: type II toxin-antitoxin system HicB family antitoxin [Gemmataceae bacterium]|jgi:predicted RNase H-like HicB family nuclease|nr:type II toxin-antitoxin system HicB family antitoxin [Gemmataceae bacterium]
MLLKVVFETTDDGGYTVSVPALPGCVSEGGTLEEARHNIREAIERYLEPAEEPALPEGGFVEEIAV